MDNYENEEEFIKKIKGNDSIRITKVDYKNSSGQLEKLQTKIRIVIFVCLIIVFLFFMPAIGGILGELKVFPSKIFSFFRRVLTLIPLLTK